MCLFSKQFCVCFLFSQLKSAKCPDWMTTAGVAPVHQRLKQSSHHLGRTGWHLKQKKWCPSSPRCSAMPMAPCTMCRRPTLSAEVWFSSRSERSSPWCSTCCRYRETLPFFQRRWWQLCFPLRGGSHLAVAQGQVGTCTRFGIMLICGL